MPCKSLEAKVDPLVTSQPSSKQKQKKKGGFFFHFHFRRVTTSVDLAWPDNGVMEGLEASLAVYEEQLKQVEATLLATSSPAPDEELVSLKNGESLFRHIKD